ncbi:MAG: hypothetical protein RLZZ217_1456, partial [Planctomycetota bacterium]
MSRPTRWIVAAAFVLAARAALAQDP